MSPISVYRALYERTKPLSILIMIMMSTGSLDILYLDLFLKSTLRVSFQYRFTRFRRSIHVLLQLLFFPRKILLRMSFFMERQIDINSID